MSSVSLSDVLALSVPERAKLVQAIWDSIAEVPEAVPLTATEKELLDQRLSEYLQEPDAVVPWSAVKAKGLGKK
jgi:putative addiction module component (TIGR02574 family)